jgi:hypothetical protein
VPLERLRSWQFDFGRLAALTAEALPAGPAEVVAPDRLWLLGRTVVVGRTCEVFLARGLTWPDSAEMLGKATRLINSPRPCILVLGPMPQPGVGARCTPIVLSLAAVLSLGRSGLALDRDLLASALMKERGKQAAPLIATFPTRPGATWTDVCLTVSERSLALEVKGTRKTLTFQEAGFEERRRRGVPDRIWTLLRLFAFCGGIVPFDSPSLKAKDKHNLKHNVSVLGKRLSALLGIAGRPFASARNSRRYKTLFEIVSADALRFPTPPGSTWADVSITEVDRGRIRVSIDAPDVFVTRDRDEEEGGRWQGAEQLGTTERHYNLRALSVAREDGSPDAVGALLLEVLRAGGKVSRSERDSDMRRLTEVLRGLMQIDSSPFQFTAARQAWAALFEASSVLGRGAR